jgi:PASTA domain
MMKSANVVTSCWLLFATAALAWDSSIVHYDGSGQRLVYHSDAVGNRIPDFSHAGYRSGTTTIPNLAVVHAINPISGDNTAHIQAAINTVAAMPANASGHRGAILLGKGTYQVSGIVYINANGIVLRGEGQGDTANDTRIIATGTAQMPELGTILIQSSSGGSTVAPGTTQNVTSEIVPVGSRTFDVANGSLYAVGDYLVIKHPPTAKWLDSINYGNTDGDEVPWVPLQTDLNMEFHGTVTAISGNKVKLDTPIYSELNRSLSQATVSRHTGAGLIKECGVENLRVISLNVGGTDENHRRDCIHFIGARNCWSRNATGVGFVESGFRFSKSTRSTILNCSALDPVSQITGGRRYNFYVGSDCHDILFKGCLARKGRHDFVSNGTATTSGIVFTQCTSDQSYSSSESHRRWGEAILWDDITWTSANTTMVLGMYCRGNTGTSHGWTGTGFVGWNITAPGREIMCSKPPSGQNYAIGCNANITKGSYDFGSVEGTGQSLSIPSLYDAQLTERLTYGVGPDAPVGLKVTHYSNTGTRFAAMSWIDLALDETTYVIERSSNGGASYTVLSNVPANRVSYTDATVVQNGSYTYRVKATNPVGSSAYSNPASVNLNSSESGETIAYQAEYFSAASGTALKWDGVRWTGQGYADMGDINTWFELTIDGGRGGIYPVKITYASFNGTTRRCSFHVNGVANGTVVFDESPGKSMWRTETVNLTLNSGNNTVRIQPVGDWGPDIDRLDVAVLPVIDAAGETTPDQTAKRAFDGDTNTVWKHGSPLGTWIEYAYPGNLTVSQYSITSGSGAQANDPKDWKLLGSTNGGASWTTLDTRIGVAFATRKETQTFTIGSSSAYSLYRLEVTAVQNFSTADSVQLAELGFILTGIPLVTPNPSTFAVSPYPISETAISMTATTGSTYYGQVEYYFDEISGNPGGTDSGWIVSPTYTDPGLTNTFVYRYTVTMRNSPGNENTPSAAASATPYRVNSVTWNPLPGSDGLWTSGANWSGGVAPLTLNQYMKVFFNVANARECVIGSPAVVSHLSMGDGGTESGNWLRLVGGADLSCGLKPDGGTNWTAIGYSRAATLTVASNAVFRAGSSFLVGRDGGASSSPKPSYVSIEGGSLWVAGTMQMGNADLDKQDGGGYVTVEGSGLLNVAGTLTIINTSIGGSLLNIKDGTVILGGNQMTAVNGWVTAGSIKAYDGSGTIVVDYNTKNLGKTTITALAPGTIATPNVSGLSRPLAESSIVASGLAVGTITLSTSNTVASNSVISQNPRAGDAIVLGGAVNLLVSVGSDKTVTFNDTTGNGLWTTAANWSESTFPGTGGTAKLATGKTAWIKSALPNLGLLKMGDNSSRSGLIVDGGSLTIEGPTWSSFSYNRGSTTLIKNNGSLYFSGLDFVFAGFTNSLAGEKVIVTLESGLLNIKGEFRLGSNYGIANNSTVRVEVNGGKLEVGGLFINGNGDCVMDIRKGLVLISGDKINAMNGYLNAGLITAYDGTGSISMNYNQSNPGYTALRAVAPEEGYDAWAADFSTGIGLESADYDGDSASNLYEYALNGDPTNPNNSGTNPSLIRVSGGIKYTYLRRNDDPDLTYILQTSASLLPDSWTAAAGIVTTNVIGGVYDGVSCLIPLESDPSFFRLKISSP